LIVNPSLPRLAELQFVTFTITAGSLNHIHKLLAMCKNKEFQPRFTSSLLARMGTGALIGKWVTIGNNAALTLESGW